MRLFLLLWLSLALPLQGWGGGIRQQAPCPMEAAMAMAGDPAGAGMDLSMTDCCNDAETFMQTGQPCKPGQACQTPAGWVAPVVLSAVQALPLNDLRAPVPPGPLRGTPASIWRPPSLF
jgi:hypothetical protein